MTKKHAMLGKQTFGPAIIESIDDDAPLRASCAWCRFRSWRDGEGHVCTFNQGTRLIPDLENTPEWCELREGMFNDAIALRGKG